MSEGQPDPQPYQQVEEEDERRLSRAWRYFVEAASDNQWLLPAVGAASGLVLTIVLGRARGFSNPNAWQITVDVTRSTLLSVLAILFSGLSIVLAVASVTVQNVLGRYSMRLARIYLRNPMDKAVVAVFAMAATFILVRFFQLRTLPGDALAPVGGVLAGAFLLVLSGGMIVWYMGALAQWLRVDETLRRVAKLTLEAARSLDKARAGNVPADESLLERPPDAIPLAAPGSGYLVDVDMPGLLYVATRHDVQIVIDRCAGQSVVRGEPIGWITAGPSPTDWRLTPDRLADLLDISEERALDRAVVYGLYVMVDMAIMALSPSVNDPNTAVQVIDQMMFLFPELSQFRSGPVSSVDGNGVQRVIVQGWTLGDYVRIATEQIVKYSGGDPAVIRALEHFVRVLESLEVAEGDRAAVDTLAAWVQGLATESLEN
jgi:uncharacterized membrane protein